MRPLVSATTAIGPADTKTARPDLTMVLDPVELWPDPETCPDWPLMDDMQRRMNVNFSEGDAQNRLTRLSYVLNGNFRTFCPNKDERSELQDQYFKDGASQWPALGIKLAARSRAGQDADCIVQCAHIRGFLRKMEERRRISVEKAEEAKKKALRDQLDRGVAAIPRFREQLAELEEAEARHQRRLDDEKAFHKARDLRQALNGTLAQNRVNAETLGIDIPHDVRQ